MDYLKILFNTFKSSTFYSEMYFKKVNKKL